MAYESETPIPRSIDCLGVHRCLGFHLGVRRRGGRASTMKNSRNFRPPPPENTVEGVRVDEASENQNKQNRREPGKNDKEFL